MNLLFKYVYLQKADSPAFIWASGENLIKGRKFPKLVGKNAMGGELIPICCTFSNDLF